LVDKSIEMLEVARSTLPPERVEACAVAGIEEPLPAGPFAVVVSAFALHHLDASGKAKLFHRIRSAMPLEGCFVMGDVVIPEDPADAVTPVARITTAQSGQATFSGGFRPQGSRHEWRGLGVTSW
jgi:tRNA (cmo5U34)-methyltransferase